MKMKDNLISLISVIFILLAGCAASAPPRTDPFAGLSLKNPAYRELSLVFVLSENTRNALVHSDRVGQQMRGSLFGYALDYDSFFADIASIFQKNFKSVVKAERLEDAVAMRPDIVAVLDIYIETPKSIYIDAKFDVVAILMTPDNSPIDTVRGQSVQSPRKFPGFVGEKRVNAAIRSASEEACGRLEIALVASARLNEFSKGKAVAAGATSKLAVPPAKSPILSDVDEIPSVRALAKRNVHAIVIGIEQYRQKLPKADYAVADAQTMTEYLTKVMGYPEENVVTLINDHAAKSDFEKYIEKWLSNNVEKDGSVFIYYSGHGAPNPKTGDAYLVPYDGDPSFIDETGYSLKRLYESLGKLQAKEIIVALDSCFSGAGGRSVIAKGARPLVMTMENLAIPSKVAVLSASSGDQISSTYEEKGHGLFTYFMLKGIKDGIIEIGELFDYIKPQVERTARKVYNNEQSPQLNAPEKKKVFLIEKTK